MQSANWHSWTSLAASWTSQEILQTWCANLGVVPFSRYSHGLLGVVSAVRLSQKTSSKQSVRNTDQVSLATFLRELLRECFAMKSIHCHKPRNCAHRPCIRHRGSIGSGGRGSTLIARSNPLRAQFEEQPPRDAGQASTSHPRDDDVRSIAIFQSRTWFVSLLTERVCILGACAHGP
jgi:predicted Rdx family selenoprotein